MTTITKLGTKLGENIFNHQIPESKWSQIQSYLTSQNHESCCRNYLRYHRENLTYELSSDADYDESSLSTWTCFEERIFDAKFETHGLTYQSRKIHQTQRFEPLNEYDNPTKTHMISYSIGDDKGGNMIFLKIEEQGHVAYEIALINLTLEQFMDICGITDIPDLFVG